MFVTSGTSALQIFILNGNLTCADLDALLPARDAAAAIAAEAAAATETGEYCLIIVAVPTLCIPDRVAAFNVRLPFACKCDKPRIQDSKTPKKCTTLNILMSKRSTAPYYPSSLTYRKQC